MWLEIFKSGKFSYPLECQACDSGKKSRRTKGIDCKCNTLFFWCCNLSVFHIDFHPNSPPVMLQLYWMMMMIAIILRHSRHRWESNSRIDAKYATKCSLRANLQICIIKGYTWIGPMNAKCAAKMWRKMYIWKCIWLPTNHVAKSVMNELWVTINCYFSMIYFVAYWMHEFIVLFSWKYRNKIVWKWRKLQKLIKTWQRHVQIVDAYLARLKLWEYIGLKYTTMISIKEVANAQMMPPKQAMQLVLFC